MSTNEEEIKREKNRLQCAAWRAKNAEKLKEYQKEWREKKKQEIKEYSKKWREEHREDWNRIVRESRHRKKQRESEKNQKIND